jgi:hypothetical protein
MSNFHEQFLAQQTKDPLFLATYERERAVQEILQELRTVNVHGFVGSPGPADERSLSWRHAFACAADHIEVKFSA